MNIWIEPHFSSYYSYIVQDKRLTIMQPEGIGGPAPFHIDIRESESDKGIGILSGFYFQRGGHDYFKMDNESKDAECIAAAVCGKSGKIGERFAWMPKDFFGIHDGTPLAVVLEHFEIYEDYRNQGVGTSVMRAIPKILQCELHGMVSAIFLYASAYELLGGTIKKEPVADNPAYEAATQKLIQMYQGVGFRTAQGQVMYYKPDGRKRLPIDVVYE